MWKHSDLEMTFEIQPVLKLGILLHCSHSEFKEMSSRKGAFQQVNLNNTVILKCATYPKITARLPIPFSLGIISCGVNLASER